MLYQVTHLPTNNSVIVNLDDAAKISQLNREDIEWAIQEHGLCETDAYLITEAFFGEETKTWQKIG